MYRLSLVINEIYNKYLPEAMKAGISFNLDFPDTTLRIKSPSRVKKSLDEHVGKAISRTAKSSDDKIKGEVKISVSKGGIEVRDTGTTLSPATIALLSSDRVEIKSRVGFGTRILIKF